MVTNICITLAVIRIIDTKKGCSKMMKIWHSCFLMRKLNDVKRIDMKEMIREWYFVFIYCISNKYSFVDICSITMMSLILENVHFYDKISHIILSITLNEGSVASLTMAFHDQTVVFHFTNALLLLTYCAT